MLPRGAGQRFFLGFRTPKGTPGEQVPFYKSCFISYRYNTKSVPVPVFWLRVLSAGDFLSRLAPPAASEAGEWARVGHPGRRPSLAHPSNSLAPGGEDGIWAPPGPRRAGKPTSEPSPPAAPRTGSNPSRIEAADRAWPASRTPYCAPHEEFLIEIKALSAGSGQLQDAKVTGSQATGAPVFSS